MLLYKKLLLMTFSTTLVHKKAHSKWHKLYILMRFRHSHSRIMVSWYVRCWHLSTALHRVTSQDTITLFTSCLSAQWTIPEEYTPTIGSHKTQKWDISDSHSGMN